MPIIIPANSAVAGGFSVDNSCRFDGSSSKLVKSQSAGNRQRWTYSVWLKRCAITSTTTTFFASSGGGNVYSYLGIQSDKIRWLDYDSGNNSNLITTAVFRDPSAWYHVVFAFNSNLGSGETDKEERTKLYINGVRVTSFGTAAYAGHNQDSGVNVNSANFILSSNQDQSSGSMWNGYMAEAHFIDGTAYQADSFGEFDSDSGVWKPIEVSGLTYGTNGYYLDFKDSANLGNDANGGTDFTESGLAAIDQTTDSCTNNFATLNSIDNGYGTINFTEGNTEGEGGGGGWQPARGTIGLTSGKWYWEVNMSGSSQVGVNSAVVDMDNDNSQDLPGATVFYNAGGGYIRTDGSQVGGTVGTGDLNTVFGFALDMDNSKLSVYKTGSIIVTNTALSTSITTIDNAFTAIPFFCVNGGGEYRVNFGNPSTALDNAGVADGNGYGSFEHTPPTGYLAICTKNLSEANS